MGVHIESATAFRVDASRKQAADIRRFLDLIGRSKTVCEYTVKRSGWGRRQMIVIVSDDISNATLRYFSMVGSKAVAI